MKRVNVLVISLVHLLVAISSPCTTANEVVRDIKGEIVRADTRYFVMPVRRGSGGGVRRGPILDVGNGVGDTNFSCPSQVVQSPEEEDKGMPVFFNPTDTNKVEITESTYLYIDFYRRNHLICNNTVWKVEKDQNSFLSTNGNPSKDDTWFQIKKSNDSSYKLVYCEDIVLCHDIGIIVSSGERRLSLNINETFQVVLIKDTRFGINSNII
ncbi:hypothetical protein HAX54_052079 [Datura stramonium]|uniref:Uncharacterized protein n=1 Tax=Datura stramonium TaxID=4076 RepID=A0ABS8T0N4_DATST|nr:hypothetical protein [Datura stramonium]